MNQDSRKEFWESLETVWRTAALPTGVNHDPVTETQLYTDHLQLVCGILSLQLFALFPCLRN